MEVFEILHSDSKDEWLKQRTRFVTATDAAAIRTGSDKAIASLWDKKHRGTEFRGNKYTEWGNEREPVIAAWVSKQFPEYAHNTDLCVNTAFPRYACTPDMLSSSGKTVQIKTVLEKNDWNGGKLKPEYAAQREWELIVTGHDSGLFAVEPYRETAHGFEPLGMRLEMYESNQRLRKKLIDAAEKYLAYSPPDVKVFSGDDGLQFVAALAASTANEIREVSARLNELKAEKERYDSQLLDALGKSNQRVRFDAGVVEITAGVPSRRFDRASFKADYPELDDKYTVVGESKFKVSVIDG